MKASIPFLLLLIAVLPSGCDDSGGGLTGAAPKVEQFHVGDAETPGEFATTPDSGEVDIDFGPTDVGTIAERYLFLKNTGRSDLKLSGVAWQTGSSPDFVVACRDAGAFVADCPYSSDATLAIAPGESLVMRISYAPQEIGPDEGGFTITLNAADHANVTVNLAGEGVTPEIEVCITDCTGDEDGTSCTAAGPICNHDAEPDNLQMVLGDVDLGTTFRRKIVISNQGDQPLQVNRVAPNGGMTSQYFVDMNGNTLPGTLEAGTTAEIFVVYQPSLGGDHDTTLEIGSNDVNEPKIVIDIVARGMAPRLCPDPLVLDFGNVPTSESDVQTITITNCGLRDLELENVALNPDTTPDFDLVNQPAYPLTLVPDESIGIDVEYHPGEMGSDHGGVDLFSSDPASDPATHLTGTISLLGTSVPRACDIQATPFRIDFGAVVQDESMTIDLMLSNLGTDTCTLERAEITQNSADAEFAISQSPGENVTFEPGEILVVTVEYLPVNLGTDTGILTIFGDDKDGNEIHVDLNGEGVETAACDLQIDPGMMNFGAVKYGNTKSMVIQLTNQGLEVCNVTEVNLQLIPIFAEDFSITAQPQTPFVVNKRGQAGSQVEIEVTFAPEAGGIPFIQITNITIHVDDPDLGDRACKDELDVPIPGQACILVSGFGKQSSIELVPAELDFGVVTVGCNSPEQCVTVYNLGSSAVSIDDIYIEDPADPNFEITSAPMTPGSLPAGNDFSVCVRYHPQDTFAHRSLLYLELDGDETYTVPLFGRGTDISDQTDVFHQPDQVRADVLFVVDCSGSMSGEQESLANNFEGFINWATTLDVDFHIGVVATEVQDMPGMTGNPPRQVRPGELVEVSGRPKIITSATPDLLDAFRDLVRLGDDCSNTEAGLEAAWMALSEPLITDPAINGGFLREDAKLYIVAVSDEVDQSRGNADFYVDFFFSIKGPRNTELMAVSAICGDCPDGCVGANGEGAECGGRYVDVADRTGGIFESICTSDWNQALLNLGIDAFAAIREFPLSRPADASTLTVTVNGSEVPQASSPGAADGWTYYGDSNTVFFGADYVPDKGDRIEVSYTAQCF